MFGHHFSMPFVLGVAVFSFSLCIQDQRRDEIHRPIHAYPAYTFYVYVVALTQLLGSELSSNPHLPILVDAIIGSPNQNILDMEKVLVY